MARHPNADTIEAAVHSLGLEWQTGPYVLRGQGVVDGVPVTLAWISHRIEGALETRAWFDPPLALDLRIHANATGDGQRHYEVASTHPPTASALVTQVVRAQLDRCSPTTDIAITDHAILARRELHGRVESEAFVDDARAVVAAAIAITSARRDCPVVPALAPDAAAIEHFAAQNGLEVLRAPPCAFGRVVSGAISVFVERDERHGYAVQASVVFAHDLEVGLDLAPSASHSMLKRAWASLSGRDVLVGDDAFDRAFVVRSEHPERLGDVLTADVRARLLAGLNRFGHVHLFDRALKVGPLPIDANRPLLAAEMGAWAVEMAEAMVRGGDVYR